MKHTQFIKITLVLSYVLLLLLILPTMLKAQSVSVNQQQQNININVPVIEKPVYIERYRTVYVEKPRVARKLDEPVLLLGYLWVYPEDLGNFKQVPVSVINSVNAQKPYGRDNWRIPTPDELAVLEANADKIGLGDDIYLATDHRNGVLRLVAIEGENTNCVKVGNTYWLKTNLGANREDEAGSLVTYDEAIKYCPSGYRLPTRQEYEELMAYGMASFGGYYGADKNDASLFFPFSYYYNVYDNLYDRHSIRVEEGVYWTSSKDAKGHSCYWGFSYNYENNKECNSRPTLLSTWSRGFGDNDQKDGKEYKHRMSVRYVLDK